MSPRIPIQEGLNLPGTPRKTEDQTIENIKRLFKEGFCMRDIEKVGYFKNLVPYPTQEMFPIKKVCEHCGSTYTDENAKLKKSKAITKYRVEDNRLYALFREALIIYEGLDPEDEKVGRAFGIAWDQGHAYGYSEVISHFEDLVDLLK